MNAGVTLAELRSRLKRLNTGATLKISEHDYERLFGINEIAAAKAAQFARTHHCVSVPRADAVYFRKLIADACYSPDLVPGDAVAFR
ncbi:hypothetical protein [Bradyrhizobium sp. USDA 3256]